jgi:hypothetical protein
VHLASAAGAVVSVYLPWLRSPGLYANAFDIPSLFLIDNTTSERGVELGILVFVCAGLLIAGLLVRNSVMSKVVLGAGIALIAIGLLFVLQVNRSLTPGFSIGDVVGFGPFVLVVAGGAATYASAKGRALSVS